MISIRHFFCRERNEKLMIYTLTLNPALDYIMDVPQLRLGMLNRVQEEHIVYGGKGINVSIMLKELGLESICLGFIAGFTGNELKKGLCNDFHLQERFLEVAHGMTRINVKIQSAQETEINGIGPRIEQNDFDRLQQQMREMKSHDILILSGSVPSSLMETAYAQLISQVQEKDICIIVDASKEALLQTLPYHPYLVKPNKSELEELFYQPLNSMEEIMRCASLLQEQGAQNVLVSFGADGALLLDDHKQVHIQEAGKGNVKNSAGAGDSMIAGFIAGMCKGLPPAERLRWAVASGSATAFCYGIASRNDVEAQFKYLRSTSSLPYGKVI